MGAGMGIELGTRMYLGIGRDVADLAAEPSPEALSKAMVRFEKAGSSCRLGQVG